MADARLIFVGSSSEALAIAGAVAEVIEEEGMVPLPWQSGFQAGDLLLERIERLPADVQGAVMVVTPDVRCKRAGRNFRAPVANVIFEYGYLSGRLTPKRTALLHLEGVDIARDLSDLSGVRLISGRPLRRGHLHKDTRAELSRWLHDLPRLPLGIAPASRVHGYSGWWEIKNEFSRWRDVDLEPDDDVHFDGKLCLLLPIDGQAGSGTMAGTLFVNVDGYSAEYQVTNLVSGASVDGDGRLELRVQVLSRKQVMRRGKPPDPRLEEELPGSGSFRVRLKLHSDGPALRTLIGSHEYETKAGYRLQKAKKETYTYLGFGRNPAS